MHKSRLGALIVDCQTDDLLREAKFWGAAIGGTPEAEGAQRNPRYVRLEGLASEVPMLLQAVDHPSRVHLDIETDDIEAEVKRLVTLGAEVVERLERWTVMQAPSGHRFCVIGAARPGFDEQANVWA
jgi:hypothetical protein